MTDEIIFATALEIVDPVERASYLDSACGGDTSLRRNVEGLLRAYDRAGDFLERPALTTPSTTRTFNEGDGEAPADLSFLAPPTRPGAIGRIEHYEVLEVLGRGGFGIVFRAFDERLQRVVAVKVLSPALVTTSPARKRFLREARSSARVRHENVVQIYDVKEEPLPYLVMEFVPGETLQQRLDRSGPLSVAEVLQIGRQVAEGLAAAHATGLIHRDIKPSNILIEDGPQQRAKITDFGLARAVDDASLTRSGVVAGTPLYMAPEQARGEVLDPRADLFSLGSVLYALLTGQPPFLAGSTFAVLKRVVEDTPRPIREIIPEVPEWLCQIVAKLHAKEPADRFQSAREVADVLADCEAQLQTHGGLRDHSRIPASKPARPRRWPWLVAALLPVAFVAILVYALTRPGLRPSGSPEPSPSALEREDLGKLKGEWVLAEKPPQLKDIDSLVIRIDDGTFEVWQTGPRPERATGSFRIEADRKEIVLHVGVKDGTRPVRVAYRFDRDRLRLDFAGVVGGPSTETLRLSDRVRSPNNIKQIAVAMSNYHDVNKGLPRAALTAGPRGTGKPLLSWRVALLPYVEQWELHKEFKLDEPWDSDHNKKLIARMPAVYKTPGIPTAEPGLTHYRVFVGPGTAFEPIPDREHGIGVSDITDGTSNTLLLAEAAEPVIWTKPDDLPFAPDRPLAKLGVYNFGINMAFCDGTLGTLAPAVSEAELRALITRNGGESISAPFLRPEPPQGPPLYLTFQRRPQP
jgi:serine/threonine protein kinase